eukprot:CAMPEP_0119415754 /NCGR_PEP_ID=MMETSP1335-20130426/10433_1 /TAXON_ID=259385 /ORGANISM="Chrysoculter rhomboideus, Strain RCC1486" /LENGTH=34 /DNA_ID= /DNA_START= /DNA_END= /DNA_ORIENTATION=
MNERGRSSQGVARAQWECAERARERATPTAVVIM